MLVVGAMKAGTTTLAAVLQRHPRIAFCSRKEPGFFSRDERYAWGFEWYRGLFAHAKAGQLLCEASTCYSRSAVYPKAAERLAAASPHAKLIYVLRHPVERVYSHYCHVVRERFAKGERVPGLREVLDQDPECVSASEYARELRHLLRHFPREQILCLRFEEVSQDLSRAADAIAAFLEIEPFDEDTLRSVTAENVKGVNLQRHVALRTARRMRLSLPAKLLKPVLSPEQRDRLMRSVAIRLERLGWGARERQTYLNRLEPLTPQIEAELHARLDPDTKELGEMLDWDVSNWVVMNDWKVA